MRILHIPLIFLVLQASTFSAQATQSSYGEQLNSISVQTKNFKKNVDIPKWTLPLAEIPETQRKDPVVVRLNEVQAYVNSAPAIMFNKAIQANDQSSLGSIGQYGISFYPLYQKLLLHRVVILRSGKVLDRMKTVNTRLLQRETGMENGMYGGATTVQLLIDDVRMGDTLWITYTVEGENPVFGKKWSNDFGWDGASPIELRKLTVMHEAKKPLYWKQIGDFRTEEIKPTIVNVGNMRHMIFEGRGIEALEGEPSTPSEYFPARLLQFSEYENWNEVANWASGLFSQTGKGAEFKKLVQQFSKQETPLAKASEALHWVQNEIRYFSVSIGENSHKPQMPETVLQRRYGDCKDKSLLLVSLLSQMGIESHLVLLNAQAPKITAKVNPTPIWFDHVIVQIVLNGEIYYVDPTRNGQSASIDKISNAFKGASGLLVSPATKGLITFTGRQIKDPLYEHVETIEVSDLDGDAVLETTEIYRENYAEWARLRFVNLSATELKKEMLSLYEKLYPGVSLIDPPNFKDFPEANLFELKARYKMPKPIIKKDDRYGIEYDSQILYNTLGIPDKIVRNFPFSLPRDNYHGRYQLNIHWPKKVRGNEGPVQKVIDNPFYKLSEEFVYRGNDVSYMLDFKTKQNTIEAKDLPELQIQGKRLTEFSSGKFFVSDGFMVSDDAQSYSYRDLDSFRIRNMIESSVKKTQAMKPSEVEVDDICDMGLYSQKYADAKKLDYRDIGQDIVSALSQEKNKAGTKLCMARTLFAMGDYAQSIKMFNGDTPLKDDSPYMQDLAWAKFYDGDYQGALSDMARYMKAKSTQSPSTVNGLDYASQIALYQRTGQTLSEDLMIYANDNPQGIWPRPLLAMQVGLINEEALLSSIEKMPNDAKAFALNEAWYYIAQKRIAQKDFQGAKAALRWFNVYGIRSEDKYLQAKNELYLLEKKDTNYLLGMALFRKEDYKNALYKLGLSADAGVALAAYQLGLAHYYGYGTPVDYVKALQRFKQAILDDVPGAYNMIGVMYSTGNGVEKNREAAVSWYQKAVKLFDENALYNMGDRYRIGETVKQDFQQAFSHFYQSAEQGYADAQAALSILYTEGLGVDQNYPLALLWSSRASIQNQAGGHLQLGYLYDRGYGIEKDEKAAMELYQAAADQGLPQAMFNVAYNYERGIGVEKNTKLAMEWLEKAANNGHVISQVNFGSAFLYGQSLPKDLDKARYWFEKAAKEDSSLALLYLGDMYSSGEGVKQDFAKAESLYRKAAEQGLGDAQAQLASMYHFGRGVDKNLLEAVTWYQKAADQGSLFAKNNLGDLYETGGGVPQDFKKAITLYVDAANEGYFMGFVSLGSMYLKGIGLKQDDVLAYTYYQLAKKTYDKAEVKELEGLSNKIAADKKKEADVVVSNWKKGMPMPSDLQL